MIIQNDKYEACLKCGAMVPKGSLASHTCPKIEKRSTWIDKNRLARIKKLEKAKNENPLEELDIKQLKAMAKGLKIKSYGQMLRPQLIEEIGKAQLTDENENSEE